MIRKVAGGIPSKGSHRPHSIVPFVLGMFLLVLLPWGTPAHGGYSIQRGPDYDPAPAQLVRTWPTAAVTLDAKMLLERPRFGGASISPDGQRFAYTLVEMDTTRNAYRTALVVGHVDHPKDARLVGSAGRPLWDFVGEYLRTDPQWSEDSRFVSLLKLTDAVAQVWSWDAATGRGHQTTRLGSDALCHVWLPASRNIGIKVRADTRNTLAPPRDSPYLWTDTMMGLQLIPHLDRAAEADPPSDVVIADARSGRTRQPTDIEREHVESRCRSPFLATPRPDRTELSARDGRYPVRLGDRLSIVDKGNAEITAIELGSHTELLGWLAQDRYFAFLTSPAPGTRYLKVFDTKSGAFKELRAGRSTWLQHCSLPRLGVTLVCSVEAPDRLPTLVTISIDSGETTTLAGPNSRLQEAMQRGYRLQQRAWSDKLGRAFHGFVLIPDQEMPAQGYPIVIATYYFPGEFLRSGGEEAPLQVMAQRGFVIVCLTAEPQREDHATYADAVRDWDGPLEVMHSILEELSSEGLVDRSRAGVLGLSFGAELVDHAISHSTLFAAAASSGGGSHDPPFLAYVEPAARASYEFPGTWWAQGVGLERWREYSPMLRAQQIATPLLIQVADRESMLPLPKFNEMKRYGKPVEMWVSPDERHVKWWPRNKLATNERNLAWFEFWLMRRCESTALDPDECKRWERLRADMH